MGENLRRKGQAALEFMTTYGWALLTITIVLGALSYFDLLDSDRYTSTGCSVSSQVICLESTMSNDGVFKINLRNDYPVDISIEGIEVRALDDLWYANSVDLPKIISRGKNENATIQNLPIYTKGRKVNLDLKVIFRRNTPGANNYTSLGTTTVKITD